MNVLTLSQAVAEIVATVRERRAVPGRIIDPFFFLVGSGLSSPPLPTASEMEVRFREKLGDAVPADLGSTPAERYARLFEAAYPNAEDRRHFLEGLLRGQALSAGNLRLAHFLGPRDAEGRPFLTHLVVTPNFDDQLARALRLFGYDALVVDNPELIPFVDRENTRDVQIVHVHGTYRHYDCRNLLPEIKGNSRGKARRFLEQLLDSHRSPLVLGYSGWEGDVIMSALKAHLKSRERAGLANKIYWCVYRRENLSALPEWLRTDRNVAFVAPEERGAAAGADRGAALLAADGREEPRLPAHEVIGRLIHGFAVPTPLLTRDPLSFLAEQLRKTLDPSCSEAEPVIYNLERVLQRVQRGVELEQASWGEVERKLLAFDEALRDGDFEAKVAAAEGLVGLGLDRLELERLENQLHALHMSWPDKAAEFGVRLCEARLGLIPDDAGPTSETGFQVRRARTLVGKGYWLAELGRVDEALAVCQEVIDRYGDETQPAIREQVAKALLNRGGVQKLLGRTDEALASLEEVIDRFGGDTRPALREPVARALRNRGLTQWELGRPDEALASYQQVIDQFGDDTQPAIREQVAMALVNRGLVQAEFGRTDEELASYQAVVDRFGDDTQTTIREQVANALNNRGVALRSAGRTEEGTASLQEVITRFAEDPSPEVQEVVAIARRNLGPKN